MTDNDLAFTSEVVQELCNLFGVKRVCTSAYHPQSNGAIERQHQTVIKMIGRLSQDEKANWPKHLPELIQAYNGMRSAIMGYSPHYLLFGYHPEVPNRPPFPHNMKKMHGCMLMTLSLCSNSISLKHSMRHAGKMYLKLINKNNIMITALVLWC